jgi:hypothetical protein
MALDIHKNVRCKDNLLPAMLEQSNLDHFLPYRSMHQNLALNVKKKFEAEMESMETYRNVKYGIKTYEDPKRHKSVMAPLKNIYLD